MHAAVADIPPHIAARELQTRRAVRRDVLEFAKATHHAFQAGWHHRIICDALMRVERGEIDRLMIFAPPRHTKSELVSIRFPAWYIGRNAHKQIICTSYSDELASDFGRKVRNLVAEPEYRRFFPGVDLVADAKAAGRWATTNGGMYVSAGISGSLTGFGCHVLVVDDPFKNREEADSERIRDRVWNIYESDLQSRLMPGGAIVVMHTRFGDDDLAGRLLKQQAEGGDVWHVIKLPAIIDENKPTERALWPAWYPLEVLKRRRENVTSRTWCSLYQQEPTADDGTFFRRDWIRRFRFGDEPRKLNRYITSDFAVTADGGDYTEHAVWGVDHDGTIWALDWWSGQTAADEWIERLIDLCSRHKPLAWFGESGVIRRAIEPLLVRRMRERSTYFRVEWLASIADKPTRARAIQARASMGKVCFPLVSWADRVIDQALRFPAGANDDAVDAMSMIGQALDQAHPAIIPVELPRPNVDRWDRVMNQANAAGAADWKTV